MKQVIHSVAGKLLVMLATREEICHSEVMKTILVPLDFSEACYRVLRSVKELARDWQVRVVLLHVVEPVANYVPVGASMDVIAPPPAGLEQEDFSAQEQELNGYAEGLRAEGLEVEAVTVLGLAVDEIVAQADLRKADYVVLGSHGHGALYHLFSGSVVTGVLKQAKCPVIVIPAGKKG